MRFPLFMMVGTVLLLSSACSDSVTQHQKPNSPVLVSIGPKEVAENGVLEFTLAATDDDGDILAFGALGLPPGATLDASTGGFSWTPGYFDAGSYEVAFTVSDGAREDSETVTITVGNVNRAPVLDTIGARTADENSSLAFTLAATDPDGDALTFSASGLPSGAALDPSTGAFGWTTGYSDAGNYDVVFTVSDGNLSASETVTITVNGQNRAPILDPVGPKAVGENSLLSFTLSATDPDGDTLAFSAEGLPLGATLDPSTGEFAWTPGYFDAGNYEVVFTVSDGALSASQTTTITVNDQNRAPVLDLVGPKAVGESFTLSFSLTAADPDGDILTYGALGLPAGASLDPSTGLFLWTPGFSDIGSYEVVFTVSDGSLDDSEAVTITVGDVNFAPVLDPIGSKTVEEGSTLSFTLTATDYDGDPLTFSAGLPAGASLDAVTGEFAWTPGYDAGGSYEVVFTVSDGNLEDSETVTITVNDGNRPPVLDPIGPKTVDENSTLSFTLTAADPDSNPLVFGAEGLPPGATLDSFTGEFSWTLGDSEGASYLVVFTVSDGSLADAETVSISTPYAYPVAPDSFETDTPESDNIAQNAGLLEIGQPQYHSIFPEGEEDWVRVSLTGGVDYEFTASHLSVNGDTWIWLYDTDGETLLRDNDDWVGYDSRVQFTPPQDGIYYVKVTGYIDRGLMSYRLDVHPFVDNDLDGWSAFHDCNDEDSEIYPKALDIEGDGIDQNCTGTDALIGNEPDSYEDDGSAETATELVMAKGMQYEFIRRREFFPEATHTLHDTSDEDWFNVTIEPDQMVAVEASNNFPWLLSDSSFGILLLEVVNTDLRVSSLGDGFIIIANDSEKTKTAVIKATGLVYAPPPLSYYIYVTKEGFDRDRDGYGTTGMWGTHDCDDDDPEINDNAIEIPGDGIDQDCDGFDSPSGSPVRSRQAAPKRRR